MNILTKLLILVSLLNPVLGRIARTTGQGTYIEEKDEGSSRQLALEINDDIYDDDYTDVDDDTDSGPIDVTTTYYLQDQLADNNIRGTNYPWKESNWVAIFSRNSYVEWEVATPVEAEYTLTIKYSAKWNRPTEVHIDGEFKGTIQSSGNDWNVPVTESLVVTMGGGGTGATSVVRLLNTQRRGINLDTLTVSYVDSNPQTPSPTVMVSATPSENPNKVTVKYYTQDQERDSGIQGVLPSWMESNYVASFSQNSFIEWKVATPVVGTYRLTVKYAAQGNRPVNLYIDDELYGEIPMNSGGWDIPATISIDVELGGDGIPDQLIRLQADTNGGPRIDTLDVAYVLVGPVTTRSPTVSPTMAPTIYWTRDRVNEQKYNLILTDLVCWDSPFTWNEPNYCPNLEPGVFLPNHDERYHMMQANFARMFPEQFRSSVYSRSFQYSQPEGEDVTCGIAQENPMMLSHNGMEHARYFSKSRDNCPEQISAHQPCPSECYLFGTDCEKWKSFRVPGNGYIKAEAICGDLEGCFQQDPAHCGASFNPDRSFFSIGKYTDGVSLIVNGWRSLVDPNKRYPLAMASHFNHIERVRRSFVEGDDAEALIFQTVYYSGYLGDDDEEEKPNVATPYIVYKGGRNEMTLKYGDDGRGIYEFNAGVIPDGCEAYYFLFELSDGSSVRLPEDELYMYGTDGMGSCTENHYFDTDEQGLFNANGGPQPELPDIAPCSGCGTAYAIKDYAGLSIN